MAEENNNNNRENPSPPAPSIREQIMRELRELLGRGRPGEQQGILPSSTPSTLNTVSKIFSPEERDYYLTVHGFDPVAGRIPLPGDHGFKYEISYPLVNDPALLQAGVTIGARVEVSSGNPPHNRIVFKNGSREAIVNCVHTAICDLPAGEAIKFPDALLDSLGKAGTPLEQVLSAEKRPLVLPPEEHFASLKSYVAGIAEMGLTEVLCAAYHSDAVNPTTLPFGFNSEMQNQIARALREIAPESTKVLVQNVLVELVRGVPFEWIKARVELLNGMYDFERSIFGDPAAFEAVYAAVPDLVLFRMAIQFHSTHPDIIFHALQEKSPELSADISQKWIYENPHSYNFIPDPVARIRALIAAHPLTSTAVLAELATNTFVPVRKTVARHLNTSLSTLEQLAQDEDATVRVAVESRENLTPRIRLRLHEGKYYPENFPHSYCGVPLPGLEALALGELEQITRKQIAPLEKLIAGVEGFVARNGHVSVLRITETLLQAIPPAIRHLTGLQILDLSHNRLTSLPPELAQLRNLKTLDLSLNELTTKPAFFSAWAAGLQEANGCKFNLNQRYASRILTPIPQNPMVDVLRGVDLFPTVRPDDDSEPTFLKASLFDEMRLRLQMKLNNKLE